MTNHSDTPTEVEQLRQELKASRATLAIYERMLQESSGRFHRLFETMAEGVVYQDTDGYVTLANPRAEEILGLTLDEMRGRTSSDPRWRAIREDGSPFPGEEHPAMLALRTGKPVNNVVIGVYDPRAQMTRWLNVNAVPLFAGGQAPSQAYATFRDITREKNDELLSQKRLELMEYTLSHSYPELIRKSIECLADISYSPIGFFHKVTNKGQSVRLMACTGEAFCKSCTIPSEDISPGYPLQKAGILADAARLCKPLLYNDSPNAPDRKGLSPGHPSLNREMILPILRGGQVVALAGVANKPETYSEADLHLAARFADFLWDILERKQSEDALRESEEKHRRLADALKTAQQELLDLNRTLEQRIQQRAAQVQDLYDNAPCGYHSLDVDGNYVMVNQTEANWLGYTREELLDRPFASLLSPQSLAVFERNFSDFKKYGYIKDLEFDLLRRDGSILPTLFSATAIYDSERRYVMSRSTLFDNSQRKRAEDALRESEAQNRLLFEEAPDAILLIEPSGALARSNRAYETLTGIPGAEMSGKTALELGIISPEVEETLRQRVLHALQTQENFIRAEYDIRHRDGSLRQVESRIFILYIQGQPKVLVTTRDISLHKQTQEILRRANEEMERALRVKDEFLASVSHELRTPLTGILGLSEVLLRDTYGDLSEKQRTALQNIEKSGKQLQQLITDILDLSKLEAGRFDLRPEPCSVAEVCQESLKAITPLAQGKRQTLQFSPPPGKLLLSADRRRLKQMLVHLLSNAVKFTPQGGQLGMDVEWIPAENLVIITVWDKGKGIAPENLPRLFKPFVQLDSSLARQHGGAGLGLALVKKMAELHGGSVRVQSAPGEGSQFSILLPCPKDG